MVLFVLMVAMAAFTSLGTTSPLYSMQQAMYLPVYYKYLFKKNKLVVFMYVNQSEKT